MNRKRLYECWCGSLYLVLHRSRFVIVARSAVARRVLHGGSFATRSGELELAEGKVVLVLSESFAVSISAIGH